MSLQPHGGDLSIRRGEYNTWSKLLSGALSAQSTGSRSTRPVDGRRSRYVRFATHAFEHEAIPHLQQSHHPQQRCILSYQGLAVRRTARTDTACLCATNRLPPFPKLPTRLPNSARPYALGRNTSAFHRLTCACYDSQQRNVYSGRAAEIR